MSSSGTQWECTWPGGTFSLTCRSNGNTGFEVLQNSSQVWILILHFSHCSQPLNNGLTRPFSITVIWKWLLQSMDISPSHLPEALPCRKISHFSVAAWPMLFKSALTSPKEQATSFHHVSGHTGCGHKKVPLVALVLSVLLPL